MVIITMTARVAQNRTKHLLVICNGWVFAAAMLCRRQSDIARDDVFIAFLDNLLCHH